MAVQQITHKRITKFDTSNPNYQEKPQPKNQVSGHVMDDEDVYGESTAKYYDVGFRVNCLINYNEPEIVQEEFGADLNSSIEMFFCKYFPFLN